MSFSNEVDAIRWVNELIKKRQPYEYVRDLWRTTGVKQNHYG
jgi:hypothetical protein